MTELKSKEDAEALINKEGIEYVSVRFTDLIGVQQHFTVPASEFLKDAFTDDLIETWIGLKRDEIDQARLSPTPLEYELYFHI